MTEADSTIHEVLRIELFGGPRVQVGETIVARFPTRHAEAILTLLALAPDRRLTRDQLAESLWPDEEPSETRARLRQHLHLLRQSLPDGDKFVDGDRGSIWLSTGASFCVDVHEYDRQLRRAAESSGEEERLDLLTQAAVLYKGPFAPALDRQVFDDLRRQYAKSNFDLLRALTQLLAERDPAQALPYAEQAVQVEPLCEEAQEDLIRLYASANRPDDARRQYRDFARLLKKECDKSPSVEIIRYVRELPASSIVQRKITALTPNPSPNLRRGERGHNNSPLLAKEGVGGGLRAHRTLMLGVAIAGVFIVLLAIQPWRRTQAQSPPPTPEQRVAHIQQLRTKIASARTQSERDRYQKEQADECVALGEEAWRAWYGRDEQRWIDRLHHVESDIKSCIEWEGDHNREIAVQLSGAVVLYWTLSKRLGEIQPLVTISLAKVPPKLSPARARALVGLSMTYLGGEKSKNLKGLEYAQEALRIYDQLGDLWGQAHSSRHIGLLYNAMNDHPKARAAYLRSLKDFAALGDDRGRALTLLCLSMVGDDSLTPDERRSDDAKNALTALKLFRREGNDWGVWAGFDRLKDIIPTLNSKDRFLVEFENECREQLRYQGTKGNRDETDRVWRCLMKTALKRNDNVAALEGIRYIAEDEIRDNTERSTMLYGAYVRHATPYPDLAVPREQALRDIERYYHAAYNDARSPVKLLARGAKLSLKQAVDLASL